MKRLLLLRHAKAEISQAKIPDEARALSARGRADAPRIGAVIRLRNYAPGLALCSTSVRTRETWALVAPELDTAPDVQFLESLYLASARTILKYVKDVDRGVETLLVIGHNPGMEECAAELTRRPAGKNEQRRLATLTEKFPTCALAVLDFDVSRWNDLAEGSGALTDFVRP